MCEGVIGCRWAVPPGRGDDKIARRIGFRHRWKETRTMIRRATGLVGGYVLLGLLWAVAAAPAAGVDDFKLAKAIPADAMLAVHARDHDGMKFVNEQYARVWAEVEKQHFERDIKRLIKSLVQEQGGDVALFEQHWQQFADLAAGIEWGRLCEREMALGLKLAAPMGAEFVWLMMPAKEKVEEDFNGLAAMLKTMADLAGEGQLQLTKEGEGAKAVHRLTVSGSMVPLAVTLARHEDTLLLAFGSSMPDQTLAMLRGEKDAPEALSGSERFKQAFKRLPPPKDGLVFVDIARMVTQGRAFAEMASKAMGSMGGETDAGTATAPTTAPTTRPAQPLAFLMPLIDACDVWDYAAEVASTDGKQTHKEAVLALREDAKAKPLYKVIYGNPPVRDVLKYVPKQATAVSAGSGINLGALYAEVIGFVREHVPDGAQLIAQWDEKKKEVPLDIEQDVLGWLGGGYTLFSAPIPSAFMPGTVIVLDVKDEAKAQAAIDKILALINEHAGPEGQQSLSVEDAKLEGADGFKRLILPPQFMMFAPLGQPVFGLKDGRLFLSNGPKVLAAALKAAESPDERFDKNERFAKEGLPLAANMTSFGFKDLSNFGAELSQALSMVGAVSLFMPDVAKNPVAGSLLFMTSKLANVVKKLDFFLSECEVTTADGNLRLTKGVVHYQEPPKPKTGESEPAESAPAPLKQ